MKGRIHLIAGVLAFMMVGLWVAAQTRTDQGLQDRSPTSGCAIRIRATG